MKNSIAHLNKWKYIIYKLRSFITRDQKYKQENKDNERDQTKKTETLYETTEDTAGYQELGEFRDIPNYDKLTWAMHSAIWDLFSRVICNFCFCFVLFHLWLLHLYGDSIITGERPTYSRHSWLLTVNVLLHVTEFCDTRHPFRIVISEDPWHLQLSPNV